MIPGGWFGLEFQSTQVSQRAAAYKDCRARGGDFKDAYIKIPLQAQDHHAKHLQNLMLAQKAGFTGAASGECIFTGDASPAAAESAWWYSDGHRLINYSRGPNTLGIGPVDTMWTLNVGSMDI